MVILYQELSEESKALLDCLEIAKTFGDNVEKSHCIEHVLKEITVVEDKLSDGDLDNDAINDLIDYRNRLINAKQTFEAVFT